MRFFHFFLLVILLSCSSAQETQFPIEDSRFHAFVYSPQEISMHWKGDSGIYSNYGVLKENLAFQDKELVFAMNGGIFQQDLKPLGLYIENGKELYPLNTVQEAYGNFYLQPNGVFYIDQQQKAFVQATNDFSIKEDIVYATQSGPMFIINGEIHPAFNKNSSNKKIRNGVGILSNGDVLFVISRQPVTFYEMAQFFLENGCKNALYLDGSISKVYCPEKGLNQLDGNFAVIIAVVE